LATNFPANPSNGDTHAGFTFNSATGAWESSAVTPPAQDPAVTVYATVDDLPTSGVTTGQQAFVSATNRLYIWNSSGWYNIALINTNPTISGASATYNLNTDGSNTVVTLVASDPEGLPISFTASHTGLGVGANAIATVTQSNNIFTFTPTTNTALGGTFTTTFTASDGVNIAGANSSFTLSFSSPVITTSQHGSSWNGNSITSIYRVCTAVNNTSTYDYELTGMSDDFGTIEILMSTIWSNLDDADDDGLIVVACTGQSATSNYRGIVSIGLTDSTNTNRTFGGFQSYCTSATYCNINHPSGTGTAGSPGGTHTIQSDPGIGNQSEWDLAMRHRGSNNNLKWWVRPKSGSYANQWRHIASHTGYTMTPTHFRLTINRRLIESGNNAKVALIDATSFYNTLTF